MGEMCRINSDTSLIAFKSRVDKLYAKHKYITYAAPRIGVDRSLDQNALFHLWATEYAAHLLNKNKKSVAVGELDGMKRVIKQRYTAHNPDSKAWMIYEIVNPISGEKRKDYASSKSWKTGEMFMVLDWLQMTAAQDGLILDSIGQFAKKQREHNG